MCADRRSHSALEMLVDDLHAEKERTISTFLCHSGSEDFLWGLVRLLGNDTPRFDRFYKSSFDFLVTSPLGAPY
ncbi:hypothetical protein RRG08_012775 [Elysia crispata]|uniref:Uncharacterized protein n=1 Tax=Elysia crispata TaxID=231223 RepID=A0AAE1D385_9GAST|nr:hypothetical protein RRG08_012775 [Elysia crispata]